MTTPERFSNCSFNANAAKDVLPTGSTLCHFKESAMNIEFNNSRYVEKESNMSKKGAWSLLSRGWSRLIMATAALSLAGAVQAADIVSVHALQDGTYNVGDEIFIVVTFDDFMKLNGDPDGEVGPFPYLTLDINPSGVERRA
jgi:hypothetical protein